jgi:hypothetical protein
MQTAVLPVGLGLFRYLPWTAVARHMSKGLSPISTTLGKSRWKRCRKNFNEVGTRSCASVLFNQNAVSKTVVSDCGPRAPAHEAGERRNPCTRFVWAPAEGISGSCTPRAQSGFSQPARENPTLRQICASHLPSESVASAECQ